MWTPNSSASWLLYQTLEEHWFSTRVSSRLLAAGIGTYRDLVLKTESELLAIKGFGRKSLNEVEGVLSDYGLKLGLTERDLANLPP
jgi:DNA-directed RNA polymerase subunit alpha